MQNCTCVQPDQLVLINYTYHKNIFSAHFWENYTLLLLTQITSIKLVSILTKVVRSKIMNLKNRVRLAINHNNKNSVEEQTFYIE